MNNKTPRLLTLIVIVWLAFLSGDLAAVSTGYLGSGSITNGAHSNDTGYRQLIELKLSGSVLGGKPDASPIELISLYAPGVSAAQILLREIRQSSGDVTFLITGSSSLESATRRAIIFVRRRGSELTLWQWSDGAWRPRIGLNVQLGGEPGDAQASAVEVVAFSVTGLGLYVLRELDLANLEALRAPSLDPTRTTLLEGDMFRGLLPGFSAFCAVFVGFLLSAFWHKVERKN